MSGLTATWNEIHRLLREARSSLGVEQTDSSETAPSGSLKGTLSEFEEFLDHNELELAWDALSAVAEQVNASAECWYKLALSAKLMQLPDKETAAMQRVRPLVSGDRVLTIARLDAERVYRDLQPYRVSVALESDGWHVDYEWKTLPGQGGGRHYVIDAIPGEIVTKRYEQ